MTRLLRDESLNRRFLAEGYVIVPFLDAAAVDQMRKHFERLRPGRLEPMHRTHLCNEPAYRRRASEAIGTVFDSKIAAFFTDYQAALATFVVKEPNETSNALAIHVDTSFVDETKYMSANLWCPLIDTHSDNGGLHIIPGSEHHFFPVRVFSLKEGVSNNPFDSVMPLVAEKFKLDLDVPAGHAVIYNARLLHGSGPNMSSDRRIAVVCVLTPKAAPVQISVPLSSREAEVIEIDDPSFFWNFQIDQPPFGGKSLGTVVYQLPQLSEAEVLKSPYLQRRRSGWRNLFPFLR